MLSKLVLGLALVIILISVVGFSLLDTNNDEGSEPTLRAGFIIYPPLMMRDNAGMLSGVSYDIVEAAADELGVTIDWVEEVGWGTALEGLRTKRYDILGTQMWPNKERERVAVFSEPTMHSVLYPYIKAGDNRFSADNLDAAFNTSDVAISAIDGEMAMFIAQEDYPNARVNALPQLSSYAEVFLNIVQGKADVSFVEPSAAEDFLASQPGSIERLGDTPVRSFGNSFAFDKENTDLRNKWNGVINKMVNSGKVESILRKHGVLSHYRVQL